MDNRGTRHSRRSTRVFGIDSDRDKFHSNAVFYSTIQRKSSQGKYFIPRTLFSFMNKSRKDPKLDKFESISSSKWYSSTLAENEKLKPEYCSHRPDVITPKRTRQLLLPSTDSLIPAHIRPKNKTNRDSCDAKE